MVLQKIDSFVESNPDVSLNSKQEYDFVEMSDIISGRRFVYSKQKRKVKSGSRFRHGDILFARITPSLENGKIAQFVSYTDNVGLGSTEFFVFREKKGISDKAFLYYLFLTDRIRKPAEKSMVGTSGRQRASIDSIKNVEFDLPDINTQRKIGRFISNYDYLLENNIHRIFILDQIAKLIYKEWFVKFRFPNSNDSQYVDSEKGKIPKEWQIKKLGTECSIVMGISPKSEFYNDQREGLPFHQGVTNFGTRYPHNKKYCSVQPKIANFGDILVSVRAPVGRINISKEKIVIGRGLAALRHNDNLQSYLYYQLKKVFMNENSIGGGTIFEAVTKDDLFNLEIIVPPRSISTSFNSLVQPIDLKILSLTLKNEIIMNIKDLLVSKLNRQFIDVSPLDIDDGGGAK